MKMCGKWRYSSTILVHSTRWMSEVSFAPWLLYPWWKSSSTNWIGGWMGPRASLGAVEKRKFSCPCQEWNPDPYPITIPTELVSQIMHQWIMNWKGCGRTWSWLFQVLPWHLPGGTEGNHGKPQFIIVSDRPEILVGHLRYINQNSWALHWIIVNYWQKQFSLFYLHLK
jgi:hypothetical protein